VDLAAGLRKERRGGWREGGWWVSLKCAADAFVYLCPALKSLRQGAATMDHSFVLFPMAVTSYKMGCDLLHGIL